MRTVIDDTNSGGSPERETAANKTNAETEGGARSVQYALRIDSAAYEIEARFSHDSGEAMDDKIPRLVRGGTMNGKDGGK